MSACPRPLQNLGKAIYGAQSSLAGATVTVKSNDIIATFLHAFTNGYFIPQGHCVPLQFKKMYFEKSQKW